MDTRTGSSLFGAALAAIGASACCAGPLVLLSLGIGGAWISNLTALEPYRLVFVGAVLVCLGFAWRRLYLAPSCEPGEACATSDVLGRQRGIFWVVGGLAVLLTASPWLLPMMI